LTQIPEDFLSLQEIHSSKLIDRFVALLWWHHHHNKGVSIEFDQLCNESHNAGYPAIDKSRERRKLIKDSRTSTQDRGKAFKLQLRAVKDLDGQYLHLIENKPLPKSNTLFALYDFNDTRGYIEKVVQQINVSYDSQLYDCCAVMIRRLLETLIIEIYEGAGRADEIKNSDGHFMMFSGLLSYLEADKKINLGRNTIFGLVDFKKIADSSAHNRRFNASKKNIDDKIDGVKLAVVELRQVAFDKGVS
jgi:hypothetical protein